MSPPTKGAVLRQEALGFSVIIALIWVVEIMGIPHLYFGEPSEFVWLRVLTRTGVIGAIWILVHLRSRRLLKRLHHLEEFLRICSWCRKVDHQGEWLSIEEFFNSKFKTSTSHGICPECAERHAAIHRVTRVEPPGGRDDQGKS